MKRWIVTIWGIGLTVSLASTLAMAVELPPQQYERLRYRLENLFNEVDLVIRNEHSDLADLRKLDREWKAFHVQTRIPEESPPRELQAQFEARAKEAGIEIVKLKLLPSGEHSPRLPRTLCTDTRERLKLEPHQIAETLPMIATIRARDTQVKGWVDTWPSHPGRLFVVDELKSVAPGVWTIRAHAFRFWPVTFPKLYPRNPMEILPAWAKARPGEFAQAAPKLWSYVSRIKELTPQTSSGYQTKGKVLVQDAQMSFFMAHAAPEHEEPSAPSVH